MFAIKSYSTVRRKKHKYIIFLLCIYEDVGLLYLAVVVVNEHKEQNETDEPADESEETEEESLRGADAIRLGVVGHFARGHANVIILLAPVPDKEF